MQNTSSYISNMAGANLIRDGSSFWYIQPSYIYDPANNVNTIEYIWEQVDPNIYYSMISYLFRVNYIFNDSYILTGTFRSDGSSKFSPDNRYANFPAFAVGWNISKENFMKEMKWIDKLKVRASWGKLGNDKIQYWERYSRVESNIITIFGINSDPNIGASYGLTGKSRPEMGSDHTRPMRDSNSDSSKAGSQPSWIITTSKRMISWFFYRSRDISAMVRAQKKGSMPGPWSTGDLSLISPGATRQENSSIISASLAPQSTMKC